MYRKCRKGPFYGLVFVWSAMSFSMNNQTKMNFIQQYGLRAYLVHCIAEKYDITDQTIINKIIENIKPVIDNNMKVFLLSRVNVPFKELEQAGRMVHHVAYNSDGSEFVTVEGDLHRHNPGKYNEVKLWSSTRKLIHTLIVSNEARKATYSRDGQHLVTTTIDNCISMWDVHSGKCLNSFTCNNDILDFSLSPDSMHVFIRATNSVELWDVQTGRCMHTFGNNHFFFPRCAYRSDGLQVATYTSQENKINFFNAHTGKLTHSLNNAKEWGECGPLQYSPDNAQLALICYDKVVLCDSTTARIQHVFDSPFSKGNSAHITYNSDGTQLALWSDAWIQLYNSRNGVCEHTLFPKKGIELIAFAPDNKQLAVGSSFGGILSFWNVKTGRCICNISTGKNELESMTYKPDGTRLMVAPRYSSCRSYAIEPLNNIAKLKNNSFTIEQTVLLAGFARNESLNQQEKNQLQLMGFKIT